MVEFCKQSAERKSPAIDLCTRAHFVVYNFAYLGYTWGAALISPVFVQVDFNEISISTAVINGCVIRLTSTFQRSVDRANRCSKCQHISTQSNYDDANGKNPIQPTDDGRAVFLNILYRLFCMDTCSYIKKPSLNRLQRLEGQVLYNPHNGTERGTGVTQDIPAGRSRRTFLVRIRRIYIQVRVGATKKFTSRDNFHD